VLTVVGQLTTTSTSQAWVDAIDGATITFNLEAGNKQRVTLGGNRTLALQNETVGQVFLLRLLSDGTGRTVTWFSTIKWAGGTPPTQTATANKADVFGFICTSAGNYDGFIVGQNL
jgi:putative exporter of polyketide antibiotics